MEPMGSSALLLREEIAELADISPNALRMIERGETPNPGIQTMGKIADALGVRLNQLYIEDPVDRSTVPELPGPPELPGS
jgi:transcriptional regulator with XRE-family HTH domain